MKNVSERYPDRNLYDEYYEDDHGWVAKVRVEDVTTGTRLVYQVSGSWVEEGSDKARLTGGGEPFIIAYERHTIQNEDPDNPVDLPVFLEQKRVEMARKVGLAAANHYARAALEGVKSRPSLADETTKV